MCRPLSKLLKSGFLWGDYGLCGDSPGELGGHITQQIGHTTTPLHPDECHMESHGGDVSFSMSKAPGRPWVGLLVVQVSERASKFDQAANEQAPYTGASVIYAISPSGLQCFTAMDTPHPPTQLQLFPPLHRVSDQEGTQPTQMTDTG